MDATDRYVLLGLARPHAPWFVEVARWSHSGALPADFVKVLSVEELGARLRSGRFFSAVLVDAALPGCDPDLVHMAVDLGCRVVVVDDRGDSSRWRGLGAAAVLAGDFQRSELVRVLHSVASPVARADAASTDVPPQPRAPEAWRGRLLAVTGAGGVGRSTLAAALASGLAADPRDHGLVLLADLALRAQQGLLHDAGDVVPGLTELVDAHRHAVLAPHEVRRLCYDVPERGYELLLGLRNQRDWAPLRHRSLMAALDGLQRAYRLVVADVDADVEGEHDCGSVEVEERNMLARSTLRSADLVVVVGAPGVGGLHSQVRVLHDLVRFGVAPSRLLAVVNRAPRSPRARAEIARSLAELLEVSVGRSVPMVGPVFVGERRRVDELQRDCAARLPHVLVAAVTSPVRGVLDGLPTSRADEAADDGRREMVAVSPGSVGSWSVLGEEDPT